MINKFILLSNSLGASGDGSELQTILYSVLNTLLGLAFIVIVIGAIRAAIALSHATDENEGARAKKRLINCIIGIVVCATALTVANVILATASG
jgi:hypothetical protein